MTAQSAAAALPRPRRVPQAESLGEGVSGLILAGGRSSRFGIDKLDVHVAGQPLLRYAMDATAGVCQELVLVASPHDAGHRRAGLAAGRRSSIRGVPLRLVRDDIAFNGPLFGLLTGLRAAHFPLCLVVAGDMPLLRPELLAHMLAVARVDRDAPERSIGLRLDAAIQPLPVVLRSTAIRSIEALIQRGRRALRDLLETVPFRGLEPEEWRSYDPEGASLVDVDRMEDLVRLSASLARARAS